MDQDEIDQMIAEAERATAIGSLDALIALCERAEAERALTEAFTAATASNSHCAAYGHRLQYGCCLRAYEANQPSVFDET